tara:strand:- start:125 stop:862 length:738 start_codon:yes stop_codon:yes gene_type:complete
MTKTTTKTNKISKPRPRKRRKRTKNNYFTKVHEEAIVEYALSPCIKQRTKLYESLIQPAFEEMVNKIIFTYKFNTLPNIGPLSEDCKIWLTTILDKYDPNKGSKAFSYFSVVTKNWFIHKVKTNSKRLKRETSYESIVEMGGSDSLGASSAQIDYVEQRAEAEFWNSLLNQVEIWDTGNLKQNEKAVLEAVKVLLHNIEDIEIFNKKAVYLYLRELTGLNTKQVVNNLNKLREKYSTFKNKWERE